MRPAFLEHKPMVEEIHHGGLRVENAKKLQEYFPEREDMEEEAEKNVDEWVERRQCKNVAAKGKPAFSSGSLQFS